MDFFQRVSRLSCSIEDDIDPEVKAVQHASFSPFVRSDAHGTAGRHGPPLTLEQWCRVFRRFVCALTVAAVYAVICAAGCLILNRHGLQRLLARIGPWVYRLLLRALGVNVLIVGEPLGAPVLVSNHVSWLDVLVLASAFWPRFVSKAELQSVPLLGALASAHRTVFVDAQFRRHATSAPLLGALPGDGSAALASTIVAEAGCGGSQNPPIAVFPEGTTTNGCAVLPFRTGAFAADLPVQPVVLQYPHQDFSPAWETISLARHLTLLLAQPRNQCVLRVLPIVHPESVTAPEGQTAEGEGRAEPNEAMQRARAFADVVRRRIASAASLELSGLSYRDKVEYHTALRLAGYR